MNSTPSSNETPEPTVWPVLLYQDAPAAIEYIVATFGFEELIRVPGESEGEVVHCELAWPEGGGVMVASASAPEDHAEIPAGTGSVYVVTADPDRVYERVTAAGAKVLRPIRDESYGNRSFIVGDPEGISWSFGYYRGQPRPTS